MLYQLSYTRLKLYYNIGVFKLVCKLKFEKNTTFYIKV